MDKWSLDSNKLLWHMDRVIDYFEKGIRVPPILIDIGLTKYCNARCLYCYGEYQKPTKDRIPDEILLKFMKDAPEAGVKSLTLTGDGEPTIHPVWDRAIVIGKANGLDIGMATNGIALTDRHYGMCCDNLVWTRFNISASNKHSYKRMHGVDMFKTVINNISNMVKVRDTYKSRMTIGLQTVLIPQGINDVIPLAKLAIKLGVDYYVIKQFSDPESKEGSAIPVSGVRHERYVRKSMDILRTAEGMSNEKTQIIPKYKLLALNNKRTYPYCVDLPFIFQISGNGHCYPCGFLFNNEKYCYGDLNTQGFKDIISSEHYWNIINKIRNTHTKKLCPTGCCRHDSTNAFCTNYLNKPPHLNFI